MISDIRFRFRGWEWEAKSGSVGSADCRAGTDFGLIVNRILFGVVVGIRGVCTGDRARRRGAEVEVVSRSAATRCETTGGGESEGEWE